MKGASIVSVNWSWPTPAALAKLVRENGIDYIRQGLTRVQPGLKLGGSSPEQVCYLLGYLEACSVANHSAETAAVPGIGGFILVGDIGLVAGGRLDRRGGVGTFTTPMPVLRASTPAITGIPIFSFLFILFSTPFFFLILLFWQNSVNAV